MMAEANRDSDCKPALTMVVTAVTLVALLSCVRAQPKTVAMSVLTTSYGKFPVQLCVDIDKPTWMDLQRGTTRFLVEVQNQKYLPRPAPTFLPTLVTRQKRVALEPFSLHPDGKAVSGGRPLVQHFALDLRDRLSDAAFVPRICVEIDADLSVEERATLSVYEVRIGASVPRKPQ
jgi:hypothetical protein